MTSCCLAAVRATQVRRFRAGRSTVTFRRISSGVWNRDATSSSNVRRREHPSPLLLWDRLLWTILSLRLSRSLALCDLWFYIHSPMDTGFFDRHHVTLTVREAHHRRISMSQVVPNAYCLPTTLTNTPVPCVSVHIGLASGSFGKVELLLSSSTSCTTVF